ncbi:MAG: hypothetical protein ACKOC4_11930 [Planctomycetia bacterium]
MRALSTRRGGWPADPTAAGLDAIAALVATALGAAAGAAALAAGLVLVVRRLAVNFGDAAGPGVVLPVAAAGAALVALADAAALAGGPRRASLVARAGVVLAMTALVLPPRAATWLDGAATTLAVAIAAAAVALVPRAKAARETARVRPRADSMLRQPRRSRPAAERVPGHLRQRFTRYETPAGADCLQGRINVAIAAGARTAHGHVGFCPAFEVTPAVEVATEYDGVEATVAAAEVLPWGVRVDVRLAEPAEEPLEIPVDLVVRSQG